MIVIDISEHSGAVDFSKIKASGIDGVMLCTGTGGKQPDSKFRDYVREAKEAGLLVGAYHNVTARTVSAAREQAEIMFKLMFGRTFELPVFGAFIKHSDIPAILCDDIIDMFCGTLTREHAALAGVQGNNSFFRSNCSEAMQKKYEVWVVNDLNDKPKDVENVGLWQYTSTAEVAGCETPAYLSECYKDFSDLTACRNIFMFP